MKLSLILFLFIICITGNTYGKTYKVIDLGADPTGVRDSFPVFEKIIQEATRIDESGTFMGGLQDFNLHIVLGEGTFRLSKLIKFDYSKLRNLVHHNIGITIEGLGEGKSKLITEGAGGGIKIDFRGAEDLGNNNRMVITIKNLSVIATKPNQKAGISIHKKKGGVQTRQLFMDHVTVKGLNNESYFRTGIYAPNLWRAHYKSITIIGKDIGTPSHISSISYPMIYGLELSDSYQPIIVNSTIQFTNIGLIYRHKDQNKENGPEGGIITGNKILNVQFGMILFLKLVEEGSPAPMEEPGLNIYENTVRYYDKGIWVKGLRQANISRNKFFRKNYDKNSNDIWINYGSTIIIDNNEFDGESLAEKVAINITSFPDMLSGKILIVKNIFNNRNTATTSVLSNSSIESYVGNNTFINSPNPISSYIKDNGGTLRLKNNK